MWWVAANAICPSASTLQSGVDAGYIVAISITVSSWQYYTPSQSAWAIQRPLNTSIGGSLRLPRGAETQKAKAAKLTWLNTGVY